MEETRDSERDLGLLEEIERDPDVTQATMADMLGVAVGTVNWHLKRLVAKGFVKVKRAERRKLRYFITPEGIALRARLTLAFIENSMFLYRETRRQAIDLLRKVREQGYDQIYIVGDGDIADVLRLTSMEQGIPVIDSMEGDPVAVVEIQGRSLILREDGQET
jgi:DNA-binding MarR family transcriptional regulator